jgi:CheY-like chemotaxis protein
MNFEDMPSESVLIVDDNPENIRILHDMLKSMNLTTRAATDGASAVKSAFKNQPDLILLDISMPGMDGFEVAKQLKGDVRTKEIPIIFISAFNDVQSKVRGFQSGAVDYISKPFDTDEVRARISTQLLIGQQKRELEAALDEIKKNQGILVEQARLAAAGELIRNISHQWRQPLCAISLVADDIQDTVELGQGECGDILKNANDIVTHVEKLSGTLDLFERLWDNSGTKDVFEVCYSLNNILAIQMDQLVKEEVKLSKEFGCPVFVRGDGGEFSQVILKVITNCVEAMNSIPAGDRELQIRVACPAEEGVRIQFENRSNPIDETLLDKIFEPYVSTKFPGEGIGMSLYVSKMIVENHLGGSLIIENVEKGVRTTIELPTILDTVDENDSEMAGQDSSVEDSMS